MANNAVLARGFQRATWVCLWGLLGVIALATLILPGQARSPSAVIWGLASLPLLIFVPGMRRGNVYSFAWLSLVSLLYFAHGVTAVFSPLWRWLDVLHLVFTVGLFICAMLAVRYTARAQRQSAS